jgi:Flp pilus assembly protein TadD
LAFEWFASCESPAAETAMLRFDQTSLSPRVTGLRRFAPVAAGVASLMLSACALSTDMLPSIAMKPDDATTASTGAGGKPDSPEAELQKTTVYWGQEFAKRPNELEPALNYAKNLKALGEKQKALAVLQQASATHGNDPQLAGEYGRLALELDQVAVADQMLKIADDGSKPDWRVVSARGTVLAKQGKFADAVPVFERAMALAPSNPTVMNNLAMAYAMNGDAKKAEHLLRDALSKGGATPKVKENLAIVLGLQGRYEESKAIASGVLDQQTAAANADYLKKMVKLEPSTKMPSAKSFATNTSVDDGSSGRLAVEQTSATTTAR